MQLTVLKASSLRKEFPGLVLFDNLSLSVHKGESIAIIGKSGSGKSTLLHILGTLEKPTKGEVLFPTAPKMDSNYLRMNHIGFVFQSFELLDDYTLLENVLLPGKIARSSSPLCEKRALDLLQSVGLLEKKDLPSKLLSGGEKQRGAIARALCNDPEILFVDEPTGNLDPTNAKIVQEFLFSCCRSYGKSLVLVTHDKELALLCDKQYELKEGRLRCL
jgi:lipoprotein-releasing system ATP-binding protein